MFEPHLKTHLAKAIGARTAAVVGEQGTEADAVGRVAHTTRFSLCGDFQSLQFLFPLKLKPGLSGPRVLAKIPSVGKSG